MDRVRRHLLGCRISAAPLPPRKLPYGSSASLEQALSGVPADFTADLSFQIVGNTETQAFRWQFGDGISTVIDLRTTLGGALQANQSGQWVTLQRLRTAPLSM